MFFTAYLAHKNFKTSVLTYKFQNHLANQIKL